MSAVLSTSQLRRLTEHKYSAEGSSILEPYMQVFWRWLVEQIPRWWAPNAITLVGLIVNVVTTLVLMIYSPDGNSQVPGWAFLLCCVGLYIYQALDAIDGKQARRTNSSSPLGELFDHGCDALSIVLDNKVSTMAADALAPYITGTSAVMVLTMQNKWVLMTSMKDDLFVAIGTCIALGLGDRPGWMFYECFAAMFLFYSAHWQTYVTGTLKFGKLDVTEAQFGVMLIYTLTGIFGTGLWAVAIPVLGIQFKVILLYASIVVAILGIQTYFSVIFMEGGSGKNGSTIAGTSVLSPMLPISLLVILAFMIWQRSPSQVFEHNPCLYILSFGLAISKITKKLVIAHMTKSEMGFLDSIFVGPALLFFNQYFNTPIREDRVLWLCFIYCLVDLMRFSVMVCNEICNFLNIFCFKIKEQRRSSFENGTKTSTTKDTTDGAAKNPDAYTSPLTRSRAKLGSN